jgi:hypothetical protein
MDAVSTDSRTVALLHRLASQRRMAAEGGAISSGLSLTGTQPPGPQSKYSRGTPMGESYARLLTRASHQCHFKASPGRP